MELELSIERLLGIWWSMVWRGVVGSLLGGIFFGAVGGFIVSVAGSPELGAPVGGILGYLVSIPVSIWALQATLLKKRDGYRLVLIKVEKA